MDQKQELLKKKALEIGVKYVQADKPTKIEVGKLMTGKRRGLKKIKKFKYTRRF